VVGPGSKKVYDALSEKSPRCAVGPHHDGLRDLFLAAHRVDGDRVAFEVEQFQELRNGGNFVGFLVNRELPEEEPRLGGPGTDQVQGVGAGRTVVRAAQRFAIDGHVVAAQALP
jgi:hypothetical protein